MFTFVLALNVLLSPSPPSADTQSVLRKHSITVLYACKPGVPVRTRHVVLEKEGFLTTACVPAVGPYGLIIICTAKVCEVIEDKSLPAKGLELFLRSTEGPRLGT